jgi:hypothetical protein
MPNKIQQRYKASSPREAAYKLAAHIFLHSTDTIVNFSIRETTKDSQKNIYHYKAVKSNTTIQLHSTQAEHKLYIKNKLLWIIKSIFDNKYNTSQRIIISNNELTKIRDHFHNKTSYNMLSMNVKINNIRVHKNNINNIKLDVKYDNKQLYLEIIGE